MGFFGRKRAPSVPHPRKEPRFDGPLTLKRLDQIFQDCVDFTKRPVSLGEGGACTLTLCYLSGMVKMERVSDYVLRPLAQDEALRLFLSVSVLALSVTFGASSPKGGASGVPVRPTRDEQSLIFSETVVPCYRGQQLQDNIPCQAAVNLCSRALFFALY